MKEDILTWSNALIFLRFLLIGPMVYFLLMKYPAVYPVITLSVFVLLDLLDSELAFGSSEEAGFNRYFDYVTDMVFGASVFFILVFSGKIFTWMWVAALINYAIMAVFVGYNLIKKEPIISNNPYFAGFAYYGFLWLLLLNIPMLIFYGITIFFLALMYIFVGYYYFESVY